MRKRGDCVKKIIVMLIALFGLFVFSNKVYAQKNVDQIIVINKKTNKLAFYDKGELVKTFSVATGRTSGLTPEGEFKIIKKVENIPYYRLNIPGGDPRNPLGDRWIGLNVPGTTGYTYGIHG